MKDLQTVSEDGYILSRDSLVYLNGVAINSEDEDMELLNLTPNIANLFTGDFNGLLTYYNIPFKLHYLCMLMNNMNNASEFKGTESDIYIPNKRLFEVYLTKINEIEDKKFQLEQEKDANYAEFL